ncbi:MAG TPA: IPT/TIG domain-containing protein [Candidatus Sulfotelmatobacter sp.]|nr:IPT/TIG domain-containing protein [Candidatus Sulfotelmatobacter sp.]
MPLESLTLIVSATCYAQVPTIQPNGIVPLNSTTPTIQAGEWVSIYGSNLASGTAVWDGTFPTSLGGTSVKVNGKAAYLWYVSPGQINMQAPSDTATGTVPVVVTTAKGSASSTVTLGQFAPSFLLLDTEHVTGIILRADGSGAYGGGTYDILGPTGSALGYPTVAAAAGDSVVLYGVGLGPTAPTILAGQPFSGAAPTIAEVLLLINNVGVTPSFAGLSSAGLYQANFTVPSGLGNGDVSLQASVGGLQTPSGVVLSLQNPVAVAPSSPWALEEFVLEGTLAVDGQTTLASIGSANYGPSLSVGTLGTASASVRSPVSLSMSFSETATASGNTITYTAIGGEYENLSRSSNLETIVSGTMTLTISAAETGASATGSINFTTTARTLTATFTGTILLKAGPL